MPKHIAIDVNQISGSLRMAGVKTAQIDFVDSKGNAVLFARSPQIKFTLKDTSANPVYKVKDVKVGALFSGAVIGFSSNVTLDFDWEVTERA